MENKTKTNYNTLGSLFAQTLIYLTLIWIFHFLLSSHNQNQLNHQVHLELIHYLSLQLNLIHFLRFN